MGFWEPKQRSISEETGDTLRTQLELAPQLAEANAKYAPLYAETDLRTLNQLLNGSNGTPGYADQYAKLAKQFAELDAQNTRASREADMAAVSELGPQFTAAMKRANPQQAAILDAVYAQTMGELADPYSLSPEQQRMYAQASRASSAANGLGGQGVAAADEAMRTYLAGSGQAQQRRAAGLQMAGVLQGAYGDPMLAVTGRPGASSVNQALAGAGQTGNVGSGISAALRQQFDPFSSYASQLNTQNAGTWTSGGQRMAAGMNMGGELIGGIVKGMCWVAREVFGERDPRWLIFREWLVWYSPWWFYRLYQRHGEAFSVWVADKPRLKAGIRWWMAGVVERFRRQHILGGNHV